LEELGVDERLRLTWIFGRMDVGVWNGSSWLRKGTGGENLGMRQITFGFHKMREIS
jgi:hypothetical protein